MDRPGSAITPSTRSGTSRTTVSGRWTGPAGLPTKAGKASLPPAVLRLEHIRGRLRDDYLDLLRARPEVLGQAAHLLLEDHFPPSYHDELLTAVGLDIDAAAAW